MAHFARIKNGVVDFVTVGRDEDENREDELAHDGYIYRRTSYNTRGGGLGYIYDADRDAFIPPKPFASWVLNEQSCLWDAPVPKPADASAEKCYTWDETTTSWVEVTNGD